VAASARSWRMTIASAECTASAVMSVARPWRAIEWRMRRGFCMGIGLLAGGLMTLIHDAGSSTWTTAVLALWAEGFLGVLGPGTVPFGDSPLYSEDSTR
jgi:hypothetical protein